MSGKTQMMKGILEGCVLKLLSEEKLYSQEFCEKLIESHRVAVVPGDAFGKSGEGFIRVSYAYSLNHINTAIERIGEFLKELRNDNKA